MDERSPEEVKVEAGSEVVNIETVRFRLRRAKECSWKALGAAGPVARQDVVIVFVVLRLRLHTSKSG